MKVLRLVALVLLLLPGSVRAQEAATGAEACTPAARAVARFAARTSSWQEPRPTASLRWRLGRGAVWLVVDEPACCPGSARQPDGAIATTGCSGHSEAASALVGVVGRRRTALTAEEPPVVPVADGESLLAGTWRAVAWGSFVRAARAIPTSAGDAAALAVAVYEGLRPGLGVLPGEGAIEEARVSNRWGHQELAAAREAARRLGLGPIERRVVARPTGFEVTIWASRFAPSQTPLGRQSGPGAVPTEDLRRSTIVIAPDGTIAIVEEIVVRGNVTRGPPRAP